MCELFAMSSLFPTSISFSLERLTRRGGAEGPHRDGWGVAFYTGRDALLLREAGAASESELVRHIERHGPPSECVISHIRLATFGGRTLANTQPFSRELGGCMHTFAHNGDLEGIHTHLPATGSRFAPIGETDSEWAFCRLLDRLAALWDQRTDDVPPLEERHAVIDDYATTLRTLGPANFLYADSHTLFVHADRRIDIDSGAPLPGVYLLERSCHEEVPDLAASGVILKTARQALTLIASVPLTDEPWRALATGEVLAIENGAVR
ncbi:MAG: class II glutamine amidotransferase [Gammaproteobacteria bacterium]|nr:class II glutamine amidotransferase [Gammaproteobacteria bacterium]